MHIYVHSFHPACFYAMSQNVHENSWMETAIDGSKQTTLYVLMVPGWLSVYYFGGDKPMNGILIIINAQ